MIKEVSINSIPDLIKELNGLPNNFFYRGHANADWLIESSLERLLGGSWSSDLAKKVEDFTLSQFQSKFHLYDHENLMPDTRLGWLATMQHYGVPTRFLDFTESPYVAIYFALESYDPQSRSDLAIFAFDYEAIVETSIAKIKQFKSDFSETTLSIYQKQDSIFDEVVDNFPSPIVWVAEPGLLNVRLDRQAGSFLFSGSAKHRIWDVLSAEPYSGVECYKYKIPYQLYRGLFALLRKMNLNSKSLYGDLNGLARSIKMQVQAYSFED